MILVVGATGVVGHEVCRRLAERGKQVRALVRRTSSPEKLNALRAWGAELAYGDLKDPASLVAACQAVEAVVSTASCTMSRQEGDSLASVDRDGNLALVQAAKDAGVQRFVFVSFPHTPEVSFPLAEAKAAVEQAIQDMEWTVLQPTFFMESWLSPAFGFDYLNARARVLGDGTQPISWICATDVAAMCVEVLRRPGAVCRAIPLGGPEALSPMEVIAVFEQMGGRRFEVEHVPVQVLQAQFETAPDPMAKSVAALMLGYVAGYAVDSRVAEEEFGLRLTSLEEYARRAMGVRRPESKIA